MREQDKDYQESLLTDRTNEVRDDFNKQVNQIEQDIFICCDKLKDIITQYRQKEFYSHKKGGKQSKRTKKKRQFRVYTKQEKYLQKCFDNCITKVLAKKF